MSISIQITGNTPDELREALASLAAAMGGAHTLAPRIVAAEVAEDQTSARLDIAKPRVEASPPKEPESAPTAEPATPPDTTGPATPPDTTGPAPVQANVVKELSPAEMRAKGSDMMMMLYNRDPAKLPEINALRAKYGVKKFTDVADDQSKAFYADAMLLANGTGEVAS